MTNRVYIMAELGSVADGSIGNCLSLIDAIADAGCDAAKLQDHLGERIKGDPPWFKPGHETREQYLRRTTFDDMQWQLIRARCTERKVDLVVSPFSVEAVRRLELVPVDGYKVASGQVTNLPMLEAIGAAIAGTDRRCYLSSGMCSWAEWIAANSAIRSKGAWNMQVLNMHCTSEYPCAPERVGLNVISGIKENRSREGIGFSDHTMGVAASLAAVAYGASVIERHVCFDRRGYGSDCAHSMTIDELAAFVKEVRALEVMLANPVDKDAMARSEHMQAMRAAFLEQP